MNVVERLEFANLNLLNNNIVELASERVNSTPSTPRHVRSRTRPPLPPPHHTATASTLFNSKTPEQNGNLGGSLTSSPATRRSAKFDKNSANFLDYYLSLESAVRQKREAAGLLTETDEREKAADEAPEKPLKADNEIEVPSGWEKHVDEEGAYYWHIATGTIQRELPSKEDTDKLQQQQKRANFPGVTFRNKSGSDCDKALKRQSCPILTRKAIDQMIQSNQKKAIRFAVRSLGWLEIAEDELTPDKSSRAVNRIIKQLGAELGEVEREMWGGGIDIYMDIDDECLRLIDPNKIKSKIVEIDDLCTDDLMLAGQEHLDDEEECTILEQPIQTIRMWGVGRDKDRDFAYVARDRVNKQVVLCHVFRCDMPARIIATTLRDACKRAMIERGLVVKREKTTPVMEEKRTKRFSDLLLGADSFPPPSEEINKTLKALYVGSIEVSKPEGMDMLISAIDRLVSVVPSYRYRPVKVAVTTSCVQVRAVDNEEELIFDARVRFIEYIGMGRQEEMCSLVVDPNPGSSQRRFVAHVFHCEPSAAALTKALEAAYKLRYQKCLDAHYKPGQSSSIDLPYQVNRAPPVSKSNSISSIGCTLRNVFSQTLRLVGSSSNQI